MLSNTIELPRGKSPVIEAAFAGTYPRALVTSPLVMRPWVPLERNI